MGVAEPGLAARVQSLFERLGLPVRLPESVDYSTAVRRMSVDKKNRKAQIHCALVSGLGRMHGLGGWTTPIAAQEMETAVKTLIAR
jgi:3-dehydroquinate synthetase